MDLTGRTFLVTGATDGIGKAAATEFAKRGASVTIVGRNREKAERVLAEMESASGNRRLDLLLCDLSRLADVRRAALEFKASRSRLDVLVNNAGATFRAPVPGPDGFELTFALNHLAYFQLTTSLLDLSRNTPGARVVSTSSAMHVHVLHNEVVETNGLQLVGLDYMNADAETFNMHPSEDRRTIQSVLSRLRLKRGLASVLMHHSPSGAQYAAAAGIGLMLSGHTHAGQFFPGTVFARWVFEFNRGLSRQGGTQVFVSQGAGTFMARVRIGTLNEINLLRLVPGDSAMGGGRR